MTDEPCPTCGRHHDPTAKRCSASSSRTGKPCMRFAMNGLAVCATHGGRAPRARAAADRRLRRDRALGEVGDLLTEALGEVAAQSGVEQLTTAINHAGAMALSYRWLLDELPVHSTWSWTEVDGAQGSRSRWVSVTTEGLIGPDAQGVQKLHAYEEGFRHWTALHGRLLKTAADIGLEERRQRFAEAQVAAIGQAIRVIVSGLGRELDDPLVVPVVEQALHVITAEASDG